MVTSPHEPVTQTLELLGRSFGPEARDRNADRHDPGPDGADAALETFYLSLNHAELDLLTDVWADDELVQLDNPVGGIVRSRAEVTALYRRVFAGGLDLKVTFGNALVIRTAGTAVYTGREVGDYLRAGRRVPLEIRTTRVFTWRPDEGRWSQTHHHGSIDDADALAAYQCAVRG